MFLIGAAVLKLDAAAPLYKIRADCDLLFLGTATIQITKSTTTNRKFRVIAMLSDVGMLLLVSFFLTMPQPALPQVHDPQSGIIHVEIAGLRNDRGQVFCALYSSSDGFPKDGRKAVARVTSTISHEHAVCEFSGAGPGTYAVSVFHDENSNGKLDTNFLGIPREGVGASNNAKGHLGPPKFHDAAFIFSGSRLDLAIKINYL